MSLALAAIIAVATNMSSINHDEGQDLIAKAMATTLGAIPMASQDPSRPLFHFRPPARWMNDPNGPIYYRGWYHLFYQFNPYGDDWGNMHWGHARSRDLVDWEHLPIALWPTKSKGEEHVFSGSTYLDGKGKPVIFYTSIGSRDPEQWIATPADDGLRVWTKSDTNPVVSVKTHQPTVIDEWRDPFLFTEGGATYMVTGGRLEGRGVVTAYKAINTELTQWRYLGILFKHPTANLIECPNLVKLGSRWLLLTSHDGKVDWFSGSLDLGGTQFDVDRSGVLAEGSYASQLLTDEKGQTVHLAWVITSGHQGWNGYMTLPSTLTLNASGDVIRKPVSQLSTLRERKVQITNESLDGEMDLSDRIPGNRLEAIVDLAPGDASVIRLRIGGLTLSYDVRQRQLLIPGKGSMTLPKGDLKLHLFLDGCALDIYADGGRETRSYAVDSSPSEPGVHLAAEGGKAMIKSLVIYTLRPAKFDLSAFR